MNSFVYRHGLQLGYFSTEGAVALPRSIRYQERYGKRGAGEGQDALHLG